MGIRKFVRKESKKKISRKMLYFLYESQKISLKFQPLPVSRMEVSKGTPVVVDLCWEEYMCNPYMYKLTWQYNPMYKPTL